MCELVLWVCVLSRLHTDPAGWKSYYTYTLIHTPIAQSGGARAVKNINCTGCLRGWEGGVRESLATQL